MPRGLRRCAGRVLLLVTCAAAVLAADPPWKSKPTSDWTEEDARQILTHSPWTKTVEAAIRGLQTEDQRREGGEMGQEHGIGFDGIADDRPRAKAPTGLIDLVKPENDVRRPNQSLRLQIRWESALPVRVAELKSRELDAPALASDGYSVAVYGIPSAHVSGDPKKLGDPLKAQAVLKRVGKKDVRPVSVEVLQRDQGIVVVYLFPLAAEITPNDQRVEFNAQIGRVGIVKSFELQDMLFEGKLEL